MIAANNLKEQGAGFNTDTNVITLITKDGDFKDDKEEVADALLDFIVSKKLNKIIDQILVFFNDYTGIIIDINTKGELMG